MNVSSIMSTALSGMRTQTRKMAAISENVANSTTPGFSKIDSDTGIAQAGQPVDLATELTDMIQAKQSFQANAVMFETGADLWELLRTIKRD